MQEYHFQVTEELEGERIDKALSLLLDSLSRSFISKLIKDGKVMIQQKAVKANAEKILAKDKEIMQL